MTDVNNRIEFGIRVGDSDGVFTVDRRKKTSESQEDLLAVRRDEFTNLPLHRPHGLTLDENSAALDTSAEGTILDPGS